LIAVKGVMLGGYAGYMKRGCSIYRCTLDITNTIRLSHYVWNQLHYDIPCRDSQRDRDAVTRIVRTRLALTKLRPEGKCPDTATSRSKMP
jgi:hypothetical protein